MQVPSVSYGAQSVRGGNGYGGGGSFDMGGGMDGIGGGGVGHPAFHTGPWDMEHQYSEIPPPSSMELNHSHMPPHSTMELHQHEPFHIQDLKGMDYHPRNLAGVHYDYNNEPSTVSGGSGGSTRGVTRGLGQGPTPPPLPLTSPINNRLPASYPAANYNQSSSSKDTFNLGKQGLGPQPDHPGAKDKMDDLDLDIYPRLKGPVCVCTKQVTIHVAVMILAGMVYLTIGGIAGFYIGKSYGSDDDPVTGASAGGWNPGPGGWNPTSSPGAPGPSPATSPEAPTTTTEAIMPTTAVQPPTPAERNYCVQEGPLCRCGPVGGNGGQNVSHRDQWISHGNVSGFTVQHNDYLVGWLQFQYGADPVVSGSKLGYTDTMYQVQVTMGKDEFITEVSLDFTSTKVFLTRLLVSTNLRKFGPFGGRGAQNYTVKGSKLMYIEGQSGALVDQITAFFDKCS